MKRVVTKLPAGEIVEIKKFVDGTFEVVQNVSEPEMTVSAIVTSCPKIVIPKKPENPFVLIEAESLSEKDTFLQYEPKTKREEKTKKLILEAIRKKVKNFERPIYDPSFTDDTKTDICFVADKKPAVGKSYNWWKAIAKKLKLKLGTRLQYGAFLGVLIKKLVEEGKSVEWAWYAVCHDSRVLGHYWDSEDAKHVFVSTGSRSICGFCDLANTCKILAEDEDAGGFWLAGGNISKFGIFYRLADLNHGTLCFANLSYGVGWLVR